MPFSAMAGIGIEPHGHIMVRESVHTFVGCLNEIMRESPQETFRPTDPLGSRGVCESFISLAIVALSDAQSESLGQRALGARVAQLETGMDTKPGYRAVQEARCDISPS
jgi:hypothetical protein